MILLDTHVWFWWVQDVPRLTVAHRQLIEANEPDTIGVSAISCWEIATLVARGRLELNEDVAAWVDQALSYPGITLLPLTPRIAVDSTRLPGDFHADPADRIIVATARAHGCPLLTVDERIRCYPHVEVS